MRYKESPLETTGLSFFGLIVKNNEAEQGLQIIIVLVLVVVVLEMLLKTEYEYDDEDEDDWDNPMELRQKTAAPSPDYSASPTV